MRRIALRFLVAIGCCCGVSGAGRDGGFESWVGGRVGGWNALWTRDAGAGDLASDAMTIGKKLWEENRGRFVKSYGATCPIARALRSESNSLADYITSVP